MARRDPKSRTRDADAVGGSLGGGGKVRDSRNSATHAHARYVISRGISVACGASRGL